jgi:hypothetical protein
MGLFFISYAREDGKLFAQQLKRTIQERGIDAWSDEDIEPGEEWFNIIRDRIKRSTGMIVVITQEALKSSWVTFESTTAMTLEKTMVPLLLFNVTLVSAKFE